MQEVLENTWESIFVVMGVDLLPLSVSSMFGQEPVRSQRKGQFNPRTQSDYEYGSCTYEFKEAREELALETHLLYWIGVLKDYKSELLDFRSKGCEVFIDCVIASISEMRQIEMQSALLRQLAELHVDLYIRINP